MLKLRVTGMAWTPLGRTRRLTSRMPPRRMASTLRCEVRWTKTGMAFPSLREGAQSSRIAGAEVSTAPGAISASGPATSRHETPAFAGVTGRGSVKEGARGEGWGLPGPFALSIGRLGKVVHDGA